jgi:hypothetical protein
MCVKLGSSFRTEEYRLRVFMKRILRKISGPKRERVKRGWNCIMWNSMTYFSPNIFRVTKSRMAWAGKMTAANSFSRKTSREEITEF